MYVFFLHEGKIEKMKRKRIETPWHFNFTPLEQLVTMSRNRPVDIIGVIESMSHPYNINNDTGMFCYCVYNFLSITNNVNNVLIESMKREVTIVDNNATVVLSLWDREVGLLGFEHVGHVVAICSAITSDYMEHSLKKDGPIYIDPQNESCQLPRGLKNMKTNKIWVCPPNKTFVFI